MNVDEWLQEAETLSVQDMPRSASSLSVRTDASGAGVIIKNVVAKASHNRTVVLQKNIFKQEHPSSESFYDSDGDGGSDLTTVERPGTRNAAQQEEEVQEERQRHDSEEVDGKYRYYELCRK